MIDIITIISLIVFYALFLGRSLFLTRKGITVFVLGTSSKSTKEKALELILMPALLLWTVMLVLVAFHTDLPTFFTDFKDNNIAWRWFGVFLCYLGLAVFALALHAFGRAWRIGIDEKNSNQLVTSGIFSLSRNPIFLFMHLYFLGIALIYPSLFFWLAFAIEIVSIHLQILREEKFLRLKFGAEYQDYCSQVKRYFGKIYR